MCEALSSNCLGRIPAVPRAGSPGFSVICHFEPVQLLFYLMKGIVTDLVICAHRENYFPSRPEGFTMDVGVCGGQSVTVFSWRWFRGKMCPELLPHRFRNWGGVTLEDRKPGLHGTFTRRGHFATDRVIVMQVKGA